MQRFLFMLALSGGCLSMDDIPRVPMAGSGRACFDRGSYALNEGTFRGLDTSCTERNVCVEGVCAPAPACTEGTLSECIFTPESAHGEVGAFALSGEHVYWVERGTLDARRNYAGDGAIARARVGEWQREELGSNLHFYDDTMGEWHRTRLRVEGEHLFVASSYCCGEQHYYRSLAAAGSAELDEIGGAGCIVGNLQYWVEAKSLLVRSLGPRGASEVVFSELPAAGFECRAVSEGFAYLARFSTSLRVSLGEEKAMQVVSQATTLIGAVGPELVARLDTSWVGTGTPDQEGNVTWLSVAGGTPGSAYALHEGFVYWYRNSTGQAREAEVVLRARLDGTGEQVVVAEAWDQVQSMGDVPSFGVGSLGIGWWPSLDGKGFHHYPLPP